MTAARPTPFLLPLFLLLLLGCSPSGGEARPYGAAGDEPWRAVLAPPGEPGEQLVVSGTVQGGDGRPLPGARLYVYQTDATGVYNREDGSSGRPRLRAHLRTDDRGRYEYRTIKPGSYPRTENPAHIHVVVTADGYPEQESELLFEGDPFLTEDHRRRPVFAIRPLQRAADGVLRCTHDIRLRR